MVLNWQGGHRLAWVYSVERTSCFCQPAKLTCGNDKQRSLDDMTRTGSNQTITPSAIVASRLKELRQRRGLTAKQFADRCAELGATNMTVHVVANIETGRREVGVNELLLFALVLDVAPAHLLVTSQERSTVDITSTVRID